MTHCDTSVFNLLDPRGSRIISPLGLQIYLRPRVTLTFDLLTSKLIVSCHCLVDHLCIKIEFIRF